jgi:hypothetical protein
MRKKIFFILFLLTICIMSSGQADDPLVSACVSNAGLHAKYLKDFRIQLGQAVSSSDLRYKAQMWLWKNTKYRFTLCNSTDSKGQLILNLKDESNNLVASSIDKKSGKAYQFIDFICNKSGIYQLVYNFTGGQQGSGIGVVSLIR